MPRQKGQPHIIDLTGLKFNRLKVQKRVAGSFWGCICDCGNLISVSSYQLKSGKTKSCGCWSRDRTRKHGMEGTKIYNTWASMLSRCRNPKNKFYKDYGGRGITFCETWANFENFYADMGDKPDGMSLDRIDNDGNYSKENCRWSDQKNQIRNRRVSPKYYLNNETKSLAEWCEIYGISWRRVYERMRAGWELEKALTEKVAPRKKQ